MKLQSQFNLQVAQSNWWKSNEPIVIAVSTGVDSMVLLHLIQQLKQYHPQITVAHVNHQLRKQSEDEEQYLRAIKEELQRKNLAYNNYLDPREREYLSDESEGFYYE